MIATLEHVEILDQSQFLGQMILQSDVMEDYQKARQDLQKDSEAQKLIQAFKHIKKHYEDVQRFGRYHPDYREVMKKVRMTKRKMDMNEKVAHFKVAERNVQKLLDEISEYIARSVSDSIIVPKDGATLSDSGCGCGSGNSGCGCQVS